MRVIQIKAPDDVCAQHTRFRKILQANGMQVWSWLADVEAQAIKYYEWKANQRKKQAKEGE